MRRTVTRVGGLLVVIGLIAGCTSTAEEPAGVTTSPTATAVSPTPEPTPTKDPREASDPTLGIVLEDVVVPDGPDALAVYNWIATFEKESWRTMTTRQLSPAFDVIASAEVKAIEQWALDTNNQDASVFGGVLSVRVGAIVIDGDTASGTACRDFARVTFVNADGPDTPEQAGFGQPRLMEMALARVTGENRWKILSLKENGTC